MTEQQPEGKSNPFKCAECGSPLMASSEKFSVCPNGHGGLKPPLPKKIRQLNHARLAGCPTATIDRKNNKLWDINGQPHKRIRVWTRIVNGPPNTERPCEVVAIADGDVVLFERVEDSEQ